MHNFFIEYTGYEYFSILEEYLVSFKLTLRKINMISPKKTVKLDKVDSFTFNSFNQSKIPLILVFDCL